MDPLLVWNPLLFWGLQLLIGPALIVAGVFGLRWAIRRLRRESHLKAAAAGCVAALAPSTGSAVTASVLLVLAYAWMHDPPHRVGTY